MKKIKEWFKGIDKQLFSAVLILMFAGLLFVWAVPTYIRLGLDTNIFLTKSIITFVLATIIMLGVSTMPVKWIKRTCLILGAVALLLLIPTIFAPHVIKGTTRYAMIAGYNIYPAFLLLPAFIVVVSNLLTKGASDSNRKFYLYYIPFLLSFCLLMLIFLTQPDIGMVLLYSGLLLLVLFICGHHAYC